MLFKIRRPLGVFVLLLLSSGLWHLVTRRTVLNAQGGPTGGFLESADALTARAPLTPAQLAAFLPAHGPFTFPAPYGTQGIRLTSASDCPGGTDCVLSVGYSYWRNINNHAASDTLYLFLGLDRNKGGGGPTLFSVNKVTGATQNLGPLFSAASPYSWATGEGWYFSATQPTMLYLNSGAQFLRYDVLSHALSLVFDASTQFGSDKYVWQLHSSNDDTVHSFTLRQNGTWAMLGCAVYSEPAHRYWYFPARGTFDECQLDKSGRYVMIKEDVDGLDGEDNVIEDLLTGTERIYYDRQGAGGHSDNGFGYEVGEDNFFTYPGSVRLYRFDQDQTDSSNGNGRLVWHSTDWNIGANHIAHANAVAGIPISQQYACQSNATRLSIPRANEVLCYRLDGSLTAAIVAPVMTDLNAPGGGTDDYWKYPKGNLDVTGQYFIWTANLGSARLDAFLVRIPVQLLTGAGGGAPISVGGSPATSTSSTSCATAQPAAGWICVNGGWLPPNYPLGAPSSSSPVSSYSPPGAGSCPGSDPFSTMGGGVCLNGGWVPSNSPLLSAGAGTPVVSAPVVSAPAVASAPCTTPQPVAGWVCLNGGWLPPDHPLALGASGAGWTPSPSPAGAISCVGADPFATIGGGVCLNGGWVPRGSPLLKGGTP